MRTLVTLIILGIFGSLSYKFLGFETTIIALLILIYWAMPIDTNQ